MKFLVGGMAALAVMQAAAYAGPADADLWIGFQDSDNGFLLDEDTGDTWMTGVCLKPLSRATRAGTVWTSQTVELVSVGRGMAQLDQTFVLQVLEAAPLVTVVSAGRGGAQSFPAVINRDCSAAGTCARIIRTQQACQG